jgi:integrase
MGEWQALHAALQQISPDAADLAEFLLASGWRWSEATALATQDVEDDGKYVHVSMSQVARRQSDGSTKIVEDAKSTAGRRRLRLDPDASAMVRRRLRNLEPGELLFTTEQRSVWNYSHYRSRFWLKAIDAANLQRRPTIHWLRHTNVGMLNAADVSLAEIQRRIGHESITTTIDVYGGMIDDITDDALNALAAMRSKAPKELAPRDAIED